MGDALTIRMTSGGRGMDATIDERMASLQRDRRAVFVGIAVTAVATLGLFVLPEALARMFETESVPVTYVRWWGGVVGGAVAGWLTSEDGSGFVTGTKAAMYGLGVAYVGAIVLFFLYGAIVFGVFPPPGLALVAVLLYYAIPLLIVHLFGGLLAGAGAKRIRSRTR